MAGYIEKGKITSIDGNTARVVPCNESGLVSAQVVIPWHMRGGAGNIGKGTEVIYAVFDDQTGVLLMRADGNWGSSLPSLSVSGNVSAGSVSAGSVKSDGAIQGASVKAGGKDLATHTHSVTEGATETGAPK